MKLDELRRQMPELEGLDDNSAVDVIHQAYYPDLPRDEIANDLGVKAAPPPPKPAPERTVLGTAADTAISLGKGMIAVPEAVVGLADLASGGRVGKALEEGVEVPGTDGFRLRFDPKTAKGMLDEGLSDAQKHANRQVMEAEGLWETVKAAFRNPSVAAQAAVESVPMMGAGGIIGRGLMGLGARPALAVAAGEGVGMAGGAAEQIRQQTGDGLLTGEQSMLAGATGAAGTVFGALTAKLAHRWGLADVDALFAGAATNAKAAKALTRAVLEGAAVEGFLEELPQSVAEQALQNLALGRPIEEGVSQAAVLGAMAGGLMGGGANAVTGLGLAQKGLAKDVPQMGDAPEVREPVQAAERVLAAPTVDAAIAEAQAAADAPTTPPTPVKLAPDPDRALASIERQKQRDAEAQRQFDPLTLPRKTPTLQPLDAVIQGGDILTPKTGAPLTKAAATLKLEHLRQEGKDGQLIEVAEGGFILRPIKKGATNAQVPDASRRAGGVQPDAAAAAVRPPAAPGGPAAAGAPDAAVGRDPLVAQPASAATAGAAAQPAGAGQPAVTDPAAGASAVAVSQPARGDGARVQGGQDGMVGSGAPGAVAGAAAADGRVDGQAAAPAAPAAAAAPAPGDAASRGASADDAAAGGAAGAAGAPVAQPKPALSRDAALAEELSADRSQVASALFQGGYTEDQIRALKKAAPDDFEKNLRVAGESTYAKNAQGYQDQKARKDVINRLISGDVSRGTNSQVSRENAAASEREDSQTSADTTAESPKKEAETWAGAGAEWTRTRDVDRRALLARAGIPEGIAGRSWESLPPVRKEQIGRALGFAPTYAQRKVKNAEAILAWAKEQGFASTLPADKLHVTIAFSRAAMDPLAVGNQSPAYQKGLITGKAGRKVERLGDEGAVVLKFASPVLETRFKQWRAGGASWDFDSYQPHITITYEPGDVDLSLVDPYMGPIELGEEIVEPLDTSSDKGQDVAVDDNPTGLPLSDPRRAALEAAAQAEREGDEEGARVARARAQDNAERYGYADDQPRDPESGQFQPRPTTPEEARPLVAAYFDWYLGENPRANEPMPGIHDGHTFEFDSPPFTKAGEVRVDGMPGTVFKYRLLWEQAKTRAAGPTPQVTEPGTKYVLPSFVSGQGRAPNVKINRVGADGLTDEERAAGKKPYTDAPAAAPAKPSKSAGRQLRQAWPVDGIDGYTEMPGKKAEQTDFGLKGGVKDEFLQDARSYLRAVAEELEAFGFRRRVDGKGREAQPVRINEGGPAVAGDVYLDMLGPTDADGSLHIKVGASFNEPNRAQIMVQRKRGSQFVGGNQFPSSSATAGELAGIVARQWGVTEKKAAEDDKPVTVRPAGAGATAIVIDPSKAAPKISLGRVATGTVLNAENGELYRIEGIDVKAGRIRATRNPDQASERVVMLEQDAFDRLVREDGGVREQAKAAAPKPAASANKIVTDDMAEAARARLKAKLGRLGSGIDPEMLLDGVTLAAYHVEKGARTFAAYARAMLDDLGEAARPFLKSWYMGAKYDPRYAELAKDMSSAAFVDEFDMAAIAAPSDTAEPASADNGGTDDRDDDAARQLDGASPGAPQGAPAQDARTPGGERAPAGVPAGRSGRDEPPAAAADGAGAGVRGGVGAGADESVPAGRAGRGGADGGNRRVPRAPRADAGPGLFDDAGREGVAPNAAPVAAPQPTEQEVADFTIEDDFALGEGGQKTKFRNNLAAIRLAKELMASSGSVGGWQAATRDQQRVLAKYVGWGGLAQAFDENNKDWTGEYAELKALLTDEEWRAARRSTRYAHYTSREIIQDGIYAALRRFGFGGGKVLEAGAGVGNFIGLMPTDMRTAGRFTAIEREPIAATIAQALYPMQHVVREDFTAFKGTDGYYDAAVGNPPFAGDPQVDQSGRKHLSGLSLHNYFFAKNVDMLREGGILAQVVTNYFMDAATDKARKYISDRTKLLGAIRLPNNAFAKNANTEVTTDIIFLQKRPEAEWGSKAAREDAKRWLEAVPYTDPRKPGAKLQVNRYFADNPDMMLGDFGAHGTMYGPDQPALIARPGQDTAALLREAVQKLPEGVYQSLAQTMTAGAEDAAVRALTSPPVQEGGYFIEGDAVIQRLPDLGGEARGKEITADTMWTAKTKLGADGLDKIRRLSELRTTLRSLLAAELSGADTMEALRKQLGEQYDAYVKAHGLINDRGTYRVFDDDPDFPLLLSLEHGYVPPIGPAEAKKLGIKPTKSRADKAPIFTRRVVESRQRVQKVETPEDAINVSMAERGRLDAAYIGQLLGKDPEGVLKELAAGDKPLLFLDPASNEYVLRDAYLSGNVRAKLAQAKAAGMGANVRALEEVQPEDVPGHQISAKVGAPWVPTKVYEDFARELLGEEAKVSIRYQGLNSSFAVYVSGATELNETNKWGTPDYKASELLSALLNNRTIKVERTGADKKRYLDQDATELANTKAQEIKDRFGDWLFSDPERSELLTRAYNDTNNNYVTRQYDGSWLTFPGKVPDAVRKPRRHQRNAVARIVQDRTALLDHVVGAGKTDVVIMAAMELRRTGLARKNMIAVPNHLVKQWAADFYRLYPGANILTATKKDFEKINRRRFLAKAATGDWDAIIIAHSSFGFIKPGAEFEAEFNQRQIDLIMSTIQEVEEGDGDDKAKKRTVKQLEGMAERLEKRIKRLRDKAIDDLLDFAELGVDQLFVDEAHLFKNLMFSTKQQNVAGLGDPTGSQRAYDMYVKTQEVMEKNGRDQGVVFATGTPVSNSLAEKYHMMRYLMPSVMESMGFQSFDAWANTFAEVNQVWMQRPSGDGYKAQNRMSTFSNVPELLKLFDQVADTVTIEEIKKAFKEEEGYDFPIPPLKGGRRTPVSLDKSPAQNAYMEELAKRAKAIENRKGPPQKGEDNILVVMTDGRKAAMDIRLVDVDATVREKGGRIDRSAQEIFARYEQYDHVKGTQLVFSDLGTPLKHAARELKEYNELKARIDAADEEVRVRASLGAEDAQAIVNDAEDAEAELEEKGQDWLGAVKAALRGFSVYDDLKAALIEKGIPEHEIAFIHDYNTDEQKAALFRKVNAGDIRVVMGSTPKMGAGTNVNERLVALHHLDVPWKPSDIEQREGRIVRQGNMLLVTPKVKTGIPGFEVEILAYVTKDTLDMRMWQIQEVKLKLINQLRTRQIERDIDNAFQDMEMSAGEMQAAATGNMDLLREIQLRNDVKKLEQKKRSFEAQKNDLIGRRKSVERKLKQLPQDIEKAKAAEALAKQYQGELDAAAAEFRVTIDGKEYTNVDAASAYLLAKTDAKILTRTVEKDGKKVREEMTSEERESLRAQADALRATGKTNEDPEVQALIEQMIGFEEKAAPLDVTMNGETFTARAKLAEAFSQLRGDRDAFLWKYEGKSYRRRTSAALGAQAAVADAIADEKEASLGKFGPFTLTVEGQPERDVGTGKYARRERAIEAVLQAGDTKIEGYFDVSGNATALSTAEAILDWASRRALNAGNDRPFLESDLRRAQAQKAELDKADDLGDWPDMPKLEEARAKHAEILKRLASGAPAQAAAPAADDAPALRQGDDAAPAVSSARRVGELQQFVDDITDAWERTLPVTVVSSINSPSVPLEVRLENARRARNGGGAGVAVIFRGQVWVFAERVKNPQDVLVAVYHEVLGHAGLRGHFGPKLREVLAQVALLRKDDVRRMIERTGMDPKDPNTERRAAEEVLAYLAQTKPELTLVQRAIAAIRSFLREHVPGFANMRFSDAELIRNFILPARRFIEGDGPRGGGVTPDGGPDFASAAAPFYSALSRAVEGVSAKALPVEGWRGAINALVNNGKAKADEVEWSGLREWLAMQTGKVSKEQVLDYLRQGGVRIQEVVRSENTTARDEEATLQQRASDLLVRLHALGWVAESDMDGEFHAIRRSRTDDLTYYWDEDERQFIDDEGRHAPEDVTALAIEYGQARESQANYMPDTDHANDTKYGNWTLPGGENYREVLLTLPPKQATEEEARAIAGSVLWDRMSPEQRREFMSHPTESTRRNQYRSNHWAEPNIVAHIRVKDRTDADGKRVLFVEEVQSDWAQDGRKQGFREKDDPRVEELRRQRAQAIERMEAGDKDAMDEVPRINAQLAELGARAVDRDTVQGHVPRGPFVESTNAWVTLALKRIVTMAVEGGYDRVAFVNGQQSADRYHLSQVASRLEWYGKPPGFRADAKNVVITTSRGLVRFDIDAAGDILTVGTSQGLELEGKNVADVVGQEIAAKILAEANGDMKPEDMRFGGKGMIDFYDKILPAAANKLLEKLGGGKMGAVSIELPINPISGEPRNVQPWEAEKVPKQALEQPGFDVTDAMREKAANGLPMFAQGFTTRQIQVDGKWRPIDRSDGQLIVPDHNPQKLQAFWRSYAGPLDDQGRPIMDGASSEDAPAFQQAGAALGPNDPRNFRAAVRDALGELGNTPGKLHWWHKTVGTQFNLAKKNKHFARVFGRVQDFLEDVSLYATEAADEAPNLLPKLEKLRDVIKTPLSAADTKAIAAPIFEGTLLWGRDEDGKPARMDDIQRAAAELSAADKAEVLLRRRLLSPNVLAMWQGLPHDQFEKNIETRYANTVLRPGVVFTPEELKRLFKLTDAQVGYYREFRRAVDKSLTDLGVSDMLRVAGKDVPQSMRDDVMAMGNADAAALLLRTHLMDKAEEEPERERELGDLVDRIQEKAARVHQLISEGYAPLSRFGHYTVDVVDAEGNRLFFSMYESRFEAARAARQYERLVQDDAEGNEFFGAKVSRGTISQEEYKLFAGVSPETIELFGEMLGLESTGNEAQDRAFQMYLQMAKNQRSAMKRLIHRKGIAGFSEDAGRVLAGFVYSNARMTARNLHAGEVEEAIRAIPKGEGEVKDHAVRLRDYVHNPVEEAQALRGLLFAQYLGGSIAAALVNATQPFTMSMPFLSQWGGPAVAAKRMVSAMSKAFAKDPGSIPLAAALKQAEEEGIVAPQEVHQLIAQGQGKGSFQSGDGTTLGNAAAIANNNLARLKLLWGKPFSTAELFNRRSTFIAAWNTAVEEKMENPYAFAVDAVEQTQGLYNKGNRPRWARGVVGATAMTFKQFSISYLEMIERLWNAGEPGSPERAAGRRAVYFAAAMLLMAGGLGGLPFVEDVSDVVDGVMQRLDYNWSSKDKRQELLEQAFGRGLGHFLDKGVSGLPGVPIDVAARLGLGNLIPATGVFEKKRDRSRDMLEVLGPTGDLAQRVIKAGDQFGQGRVVQAGLTLSPIAARNVAKAIEMGSTGQYKNDAGYKVLDVTEGEGLAKAIGFQPNAVARRQEADRQVQEMVELVKLRESEIAAEWAKAISEGRATEGARRAREQLAAWNSKNPQTPIRIKLSDVLKRARNMSMDRRERLAKTAPREVREEVNRRLAEE